MSTILETLMDLSRERAIAAEKELPLELLKQKISPTPKKGAFAFKKALQTTGLSVIGEVKKASPSKGLIAENFPYLDIARAYEQGGVNAISVLTEPNYFLGSNKYLQEIVHTVKVPVLRKDFMTNAYQIYESAYLGADAVLLIVAGLNVEQLTGYIQLSQQLGLSAIVETHDAAEIKIALAAGADILGVNNRNLKDFTVNLDNAAKLRDLVPSSVLFIAESGISSLEDVRAIKQSGADACLVGEFLMRAEDKRKTVQAMKAL